MQKVTPRRVVPTHTCMSVNAHKLSATPACCRSAAAQSMYAMHPQQKDGISSLSCEDFPLPEPARSLWSSVPFAWQPLHPDSLATFQ